VSVTFQARTRNLIVFQKRNINFDSMNTNECTGRWQVRSHNIDVSKDANRSITSSREGSVEEIDLVVTSECRVAELRLVGGIDVT
jgi:hypothetical protein